MTVRVVSETIAKDGTVSERTLIATFRSEVWADRFLANEETEVYSLDDPKRLIWRLVKVGGQW